MPAGLSSDHHHHHHLLMDTQNLYDFPYQFPYTGSETNDHELATLTRRFSRSASIQEPLFNFKEKQVFTGSPELNSGWSGSSRSQVPSLPPFIKTDEDAWNLIYAAAGQVARMKLMTNNKGVIGVPQAFEHHHRSPWQQHFRRNRGISAWPQRKAVVDGGNAAAKRECVGTGVFLPRRYGGNGNPPESGKRQACLYANLPPGMFQSSTTSSVPVTGSPQVQRHYEWLMGRREAMILAARQEHRRLRNNNEGMVMEPAVNNPAVLLPHEWTY